MTSNLKKRWTDVHRFVCRRNSRAHFCVIFVELVTKQIPRPGPSPCPQSPDKVRWSTLGGTPGNPNESLDKPTRLNVFSEGICTSRPLGWLCKQKSLRFHELYAIYDGRKTERRLKMPGMPQMLTSIKIKLVSRRHMTATRTTYISKESSVYRVEVRNAFQRLIALIDHKDANIFECIPTIIHTNIYSFKYIHFWWCWQSINFTYAHNKSNCRRSLTSVVIVFNVNWEI